MDKRVAFVVVLSSASSGRMLGFSEDINMLWTIPMPAVPSGASATIAVSPDKIRFFFSGGSQPIKLYRAADGSHLDELREHNGVVSELVWSQAADAFASCSRDGRAIIWGSNRRVRYRLMEHAGYVQAVCFSPDGKVLVTGGSDGAVLMFEVSTGVRLRRCSTMNSVTSLAHHPSADVVAVGLKRGVVSLIKQSTATMLSECVCHTDSLRSVRWSLNGRNLLTASNDSLAKLLLYNTSDSSLTETAVFRHDAAVNSARWTDDGKHIMTASQDSSLRIFDAETTNQLNKVTFDAPVALAEVIEFSYRENDSSSDLKKALPERTEWELVISVAEALSAPLKSAASVAEVESDIVEVAETVRAEIQTEAAAQRELDDLAQQFSRTASTLMETQRDIRELVGRFLTSSTPPAPDSSLSGLVERREAQRRDCHLAQTKFSAAWSAAVKQSKLKRPSFHEKTIKLLETAAAAKASESAPISASEPASLAVRFQEALKSVKSAQTALIESQKVVRSTAAACVLSLGEGLSLLVEQLRHGSAAIGGTGHSPASSAFDINTFRAELKEQAAAASDSLAALSQAQKQPTGPSQELMATLASLTLAVCEERQHSYDFLEAINQRCSEIAIQVAPTTTPEDAIAAAKILERTDKDLDRSRKKRATLTARVAELAELDTEDPDADPQALEAARKQLLEMEETLRTLVASRLKAQAEYASSLGYFPELRAAYPSLLTVEEEKLGSSLIKGRTLDDYHFVRRLGLAGANHRVELRKMQEKDVVIKIYDIFSSSGERAVEVASRRFYRECNILLQLKHPCIAGLEGVFVQDEAGRPGHRLGCLVLTHYAGGDLSEWLAHPQSRPFAARIRVARDVLRALEHIARCCVVHCDIKPGNIFVSADGAGVLGDFDVSKDSKQRTLSAATLAQTFAGTSSESAAGRGMVGTIEFMAPEVREGKMATWASDMFSFGLVMRWLFEDQKQHTAAAAVAEIISQLTAKNPKDRPSAAAVLSNSLFSGSFSPVQGMLRLPSFWSTSSLEIENIQKWTVTEHQETPSVVAAVKALIEEASRGKLILKTCNVTRLENPGMFKLFSAEMDAILGRNQGKCVPVTDIVSMSVCDQEFLGNLELNSLANEVILFHGTSAAVIDIIKVQGLDHRATTAAGCFGNGIYFAEDPIKSHSYTQPAKDGSRYMIIARVVLGTPHHTKVRLENARRAPLNSETGFVCDSVLAAAGVGASPHREFIVYSTSQCFAQFVVQYTL